MKFKELFKSRKDKSSANETDSSKEEKATQEVDLSGVKEPYKQVAESLLASLMELLAKLVALENEVFPRQKEKGIWQIYKEKYSEIITSICTEKLLNRGYAGSIRQPATYSYIYEQHKVLVTMKSDKKAIFEFYFERGISEKHQFTFLRDEEGWKIDVFKYGFQSETTWYIFNI